MVTDISDIYMLKQKKVCLCFDIYGMISFKLSLMIDTTRLYSLMPVYMTWTIGQGHFLWESKTVDALLLAKFSIDLWKFGLPPWAVVLLKLMSHLFHITNTKQQKMFHIIISPE